VHQFLDKPSFIIVGFFESVRHFDCLLASINCVLKSNMNPAGERSVCFLGNKQLSFLTVFKQTNGDIIF